MRPMLRVLLLSLLGTFALIACSPSERQVESQGDVAPVDGGAPVETVDAPGRPRFLNSFATW